MKKNIYLFMVLSFLTGLNLQAQEGTVKIKTSAECNDCKKSIEAALKFARGVKSAKLDVASKEVTVVYKSEKTDPDKIRTVISKAGYDADSIAANPKAYSKLAPCCKKGGHD